MATVGEFNFCAVADLVGNELGQGHILWVKCVDLDDPNVRYDCVETTRVDSNCLDNVWELLDDA